MGPPVSAWQLCGSVIQGANCVLNAQGRMPTHIKSRILPYGRCRAQSAGGGECPASYDAHRLAEIGERRLRTGDVRGA